MDNNFDTDILQICRTCMKEITDASFLYLDCISEANTQLTIRQKLHSCIPELVSKSKSYLLRIGFKHRIRRSLCSKCVDNLLSIVEFKKNCLQSEILINKYIQQVQHTGDLSLIKVVRFHQPKSSTIKNLEITENVKNDYLVCDSSAFNETSECTKSFQQPDLKNPDPDIELKMEDLDTKVKIEHIEITENFNNEDLVSNNALNETSEYTESIEPKYLLKLEMADNMQYVPLNTYDDYNINYNLSTAKENSNTHNSNIVQNYLPEVIEHQDNYTKNLNKTNAYYQYNRYRHKEESKLRLISHLNCHTQKNFYHKEIISKRLSSYRCFLCNYLTEYKCLFDFHNRIHLTKKDYKDIFKHTDVHAKAFHTTIKVNKTIIKDNRRKRVKNCKTYNKHSFKNKSNESKQHFSNCNSLKPTMRAHIVEKPFKCSICEYQCNFKVNLQRHMRLHTVEKPFSCSICNYQCSWKSRLNRHMLIHTEEKSFSCSVCEYQCSNNYYLKQHILIHTEEKPFSCSLCNYQCNRKSQLNQHMQLHTGEKPFSCSVCEYQCSRKEDLKHHMRIHTGEKPFSCSVCEFQCRRKQDLTRHMKIHTGEKPFKCSICEYQCIQKGNLKRHMRIHTAETFHVNIL